MKNKKVYRITLQYPETGNIDIREIVVDADTSIYDSVEVAVKEGLITNEEVNYITAINDITNTAANKSVENEEHTIHQSILYQANQVVLTPKENYGTSKQFSSLINDLHVTDEEYTIMFDNGNITNNEITILIYPNKFDDIEDMIKYNINKVKSILNLNSKKTVSVNYILNEDIEKFLETDEQNFGCCECDECEQNCCYDCDEKCCDKHPDYPDNSYGNCNECECDSCGECCETDEDEECDECDDLCSCYMNPDFDCCKSCDTAEDCGCYTQKKLRHEFSHSTWNPNPSNSEPEKTIRIPVTPINPSEEIIMLAEAISKRLAMLTEIDGDGKIVISVEKDLDGNVKSSLRIKKVLDVMCDL